MSKRLERIEKLERRAHPPALPALRTEQKLVGLVEAGLLRQDPDGAFVATVDDPGIARVAELLNQARERQALCSD